jgi:hypothetical protein
MISGKDNKSHVGSPRKLSSLRRVINANYCSVNDFRVFEENTFQLSWWYCRDSNVSWLEERWSPDSPWKP